MKQQGQCRSPWALAVCTHRHDSTALPRWRGPTVSSAPALLFHFLPAWSQVHGQQCSKGQQHLLQIPVSSGLEAVRDRCGFQCVLLFCFPASFFPMISPADLQVLQAQHQMQRQKVFHRLLTRSRNWR